MSLAKVRRLSVGFGMLAGCATAVPATKTVSSEPTPLSAPKAPPDDGHSDLPVIAEQRVGTSPGWLGVALAGRAPNQPGVVISSILRRSPAAVHGLQVGDVVLGINEARVNDPAELSRLIAGTGAGGRANLMVQRQADNRLFAVQLGANPGLEGQLRLGFLDAGAPEFERVEVAQGEVGPTLTALRGQVVVLEFWATWCGACRALLPTLNAWHDRYRPQGALVVSVTMDPVQKAAEDAAELGLQYPVLSDPDGMTARAYQAFALPTLFVIDRRGVVRDVSVGYDPGRIAEVEVTLQRLISEI